MKAIDCPAPDAAHTHAEDETASSRSCAGTLMRFMPTLASPVGRRTNWSGMPESTPDTPHQVGTGRSRWGAGMGAYAILTGAAKTVVRLAT